jgi:uncharacterized Zn-binding protein involved in type VI secretion
MPAATRKGDLCTGHNGWPARPSTSGSPNVKINGIPAVRVSDSYATHGKWVKKGDDKKWSEHGGALASGSGTVKINGKPAGRVGDSVNCGSKVAEGSPTVNFG